MTIRVSPRVRATVVGLAMALAFAVHAVAQPKTFDVVSIKIDTSASSASTIGFDPGGRFEAVNESLPRIISAAYSPGAMLPRNQIIGGPGWVDSERFVVHAIGDPAASEEERRTMLQAALADRFKLAAHRERREMPIYSLVAARADGRLGARLKPSDVDCDALRSTRSAPPPPAPGQTPACIKVFGTRKLMGRGMTISELALGEVVRFVDRPVEDHTGLSGSYEWTLEWSGDASDQTVPSTIFTALQEQLGLRLEQARGMVDVIVIDHVERPTPD